MNNDDTSSASDKADFFKKTTPSTVASAQPSEGTGTATLQPHASGWRARIKAIHVAGMAFALAAAWIFGKPLLAGSADEVTGPAGVDSATSRYFADPNAAAPPVDRAKRLDAPASAPPDPVEASASAPASQASAATGGLTPPSEVDALRSQVTFLQAELSSAHATAAVCPPVAAPASTTPAEANTTKPAKHRVTRRPLIRDDLDVGDRGVLSAYHLNTIYNGQAWIEGEQRTYVVEPGMSIDGMRIERIDATRRRVTTSQGEIR